MIAFIWRWLHPDEAHHSALTEHRKALVAEARELSRKAATQALDLIEETQGQRKRMEAELGPINDLLARMDKRRHD